MKRGRVIMTVVGVVVVLAAGLIYLMFEFMAGPMYRPGIMQGKVTAIKPAMVIPDYFIMGDGARLFYRSQGEGIPVLVLHGGPGYPFTETWDALGAVPGYRFIYFDQRGCGKSDRPFERFDGSDYYQNLKTLEGKLGIEAQLADIEAIRAGLGQERITLIGHSFGGFLAALYAAEFPEKVDRLVAPASVMVMPASDGGLYAEVERRLANPEDRERFKEYMARFFDFQSIFAKSESELSDLNGEFMEYYVKAAGEGAQGAVNAAVRSAASYERSSLGGFVSSALFFSLGRKHDFRPALSRIKAKTLIMVGGNDLAGNEKVIREQYGSVIPNATVAVFPGAGHFVFEENPRDFSDSIALLLKQGH